MSPDDLAYLLERAPDKMGTFSLGAWQVDRYLASGKSAAVFLARDATGGHAAVKIFFPTVVDRSGKAAQLERIARETSLKDHEHPNLVRIRDGGECPQTKLLYVVMDVVEAPNLYSVLDSFPREQIWPAISQLASAAEFLEGRGFVHRDIKPDNIAVSPDFTHITLLDLGVIRPLSGSAITDEDSRKFVGTLQYGPPEFLQRAEEDTIDAWRAITFYQIGAVIHDIIRRERLFARYADPYPRLVKAIESTEPECDAEDVPRELVFLARNCLLKRPEDRLRFLNWKSFQPPNRRSRCGFQRRCSQVG